MKRPFSIYCPIVVFILLFSVKGLKGQELSQQEMKAAFIFNFTKYITWKGETPEDIFSIGVYGNDNMVMDNILEEMTLVMNKRAKRQKFQINHYDLNSLINADMDLLYIPKASPTEITAILELTYARPVLTIGDNLPNFCTEGGIINFLPARHPKPFKINREAASQAGLSIKPKLLKISKICQPLPDN